MTAPQSEFVGLEEILEKVELSRAAFYRWIKRGIIPKGQEGRTRRSGGRSAVWPRGVIAHIRECQRLLSRNTPWEELPEFEDR